MSVGPVKYHTRDYLVDRHPYNAETSFETQRGRDAGKVQKGLLPEGGDALIDNIQDVNLAADQRAIALKHLLAYSSSAEKKVEFVRKGIIPALAALIQSKPDATIECLCCQLFRSLSVLPQGAHAVVQEGGLMAVVESLRDRRDLGDREEARIAASTVLSMISSSWAGRGWILGIDIPDSMQLEGRQLEAPLSADAMQQQITALFETLVLVCDKDRGSRKALLNVLQTLAHLTLEEEGLLKLLEVKGIEAITEVLKSFASDDVWVYSENPLDSDCVQQAVTTVWHVCLNEDGKAAALTVPEVVPTFALLLKALVGTKDRLVILKTAISGAVSALMLEPDQKRAAVSGELKLAELAVKLLREANEVFVPLHMAKKRGEVPPPGPACDDVLSIMKNTVQAIRLVAELPAGRDLFHQILSKDEKELRRQLFASTPWQQDFEVWVY